MDWQDIEAKLCEQAEQVCRHLLPNGKREGNNFVIGDLAGGEGDSLKINIEGKVGVWRDFAAGKGGKTLMSLWCAVRHQEFKICIKEAKQFLGIQDNFEKRVKSYQPAPDAGQREMESATYRAVSEQWAKLEPLDEAGPVWKYLTETRKIAPECIRELSVREFPARGTWVMVFPYFGVPSEAEATRADIGRAVLGAETAPAWLKFERLDRPDGKKKEWTSRNPEKSLFGVQLAQTPRYQQCRHLLICEGEKDAMTWAAYGCAEWGVLPVSVPFGAKWKGQVLADGHQRPSPNRDWLDRCWDWMQSFETVFVAMDSDEAGKRAAADIIAEIGQRRCRLVELPKDPTEKPYKDANDCLLAGVPPEEMRFCVEHARDFAPEKVVAATAVEGQFMDWIFETPLERGFTLPFEFPWRVRLGEMTVWTGVEGSGKSTMLDFVLVQLAAQGERCFVASFEVKMLDTLEKLNRQAMGGLLYDRRMVKKIGADTTALESYRAEAKARTLEVYRWLAPKLWIYDHVGIGHWRDLIDDIRWTRRRYGVTQFVVDNFMRLGFVKDDYAQQADAVTAFASLAMELDIHIHLVVHQNKSEQKKGSSGKRTVMGAGEIIANAHNIVEVRRDAQKGLDVNRLFEKFKIGAIAEKQFEDEMHHLNQVPDGEFILSKQRNAPPGGVQDAAKYLWFLWESQQFTDKPKGHGGHTAIRFVEITKRAGKEKPELPFEPPEELD